MSSESETEQHINDVEVEEGESDSNEEVESKEDCAESDSKDEESNENDKSVDREKGENASIKPEMDLRQLKLIERFEKLYGKCLYVAFPYDSPNIKLAEKVLKEHCSHVVDVSYQKNKNAAFLVKLDSPDNREKAIKDLNGIKLQGQNLRVSIPHWEKSDNVVKMLIMMTKQQAKKFSINKRVQTVHTSTITVKNVPADSTITDIEELFPNAVSIKINFLKERCNTSCAIVRLPTPKDAIEAVNSQFKFRGNILHVELAKPRKFEKNQQNKYFKSRPYHSNGPFTHKPWYVKGGKRKLEDLAESSSPKKEKRDSDKVSSEEKQTETNENGKNLERTTKQTPKKDLANIKDKKHDVSMKKQIQKNQNNETIKNGTICEDATRNEKKNKKEKSEKPRKLNPFATREESY